MSNQSTFKYFGFLSYSHKDQEAGEWVHQSVEQYKVPTDLKRGDSTSVPSKLSPVFRDRFNLEAGHSLTEQVTQALCDSENLIVVCSPDSAKSDHVNEEIRLFKATGRTNRVFPIIVAGEPDDPERECFPRMLRSVLGPNGQPTSEVEEPIAADAREEGDGKELALLKLLAGLLNVDLDELRKREDVRRRQELRKSRIIAAAMTFLAAAAVAAFFLAYLSMREADARYEESLTQSLKLIVTKASYETILASYEPELGDRTFQVAMVVGKEQDLAFKDFLISDHRGSDYVFWQLAKVLLEFVESPPRELERFRLRREWLTHGLVIMNNLTRHHQGRPEYDGTLEEITDKLKNTIQ